MGRYSLVVDSERRSEPLSVTGVAVAVVGADAGKAPSAAGLRKYDDVLPGHPSNKATSDATENSPGITSIQMPPSQRGVVGLHSAAPVVVANTRSAVLQGALMVVDVVGQPSPPLVSFWRGMLLRLS